LIDTEVVALVPRGWDVSRQFTEPFLVTWVDLVTTPILVFGNVMNIKIQYVGHVRGHMPR